MMRPNHNPKRENDTSTDTEDSGCRESLRVLRGFYHGIKGQAECIPYADVKDSITRKLGEHLTHPTNLPTDRWMDVMARLGDSDPCSLGKVDYYKEWPRGEEPKSPIYLYLTNIFAQNGGTLWRVLDALLEDKFTDVLIAIQPDISEFVANYTPDAVNQRRSVNLALNSLDSGVGQSMRSDRSFLSQRNEVDNPVYTSVKKYDFLHDPRLDRIDLSVKEFQETISIGDKENPFNLREDPSLKPLFRPYIDEEEEDFEDPFSFEEEKLSKSIKVAILHTEIDEDIAEDLARRLHEEHQFKTYLLKNLSAMISLDQGMFVMSLMENMDFLVPVLSRAYLQEIVPTRKVLEMNYDSSLIRYIHSVSQSRIINRNSLNYLVRPIMADDVNYGMVRRWFEFQSAVKYPKDLGRLAKNLRDTKDILHRKMFGRV